MEKNFAFLDDLKDRFRPKGDVLDKVNWVISLINEALKENGIDANCVPGGSVAKGTFLKDDYDVDLFTKFSKKYADDDISNILEKTLKKVFKGIERVHGSRDYFQFIYQELNYEVVPVLDISSPDQAINVTDMSPMHVVWVKENIEKGQQDEIRLAKQFCKAQKVYGAESYIKGFSGHLIDILILYYGSFISLVKHARNWKPKVVIDINEVYKGKDALFELNKSKTHGPMVAIDPVLADRNAAAALSVEKFKKFISASKKFLKKPSSEFFKKSFVSIKDLAIQFDGKNLIAIELFLEDDKEDVAGCKALKTYEYIANKCEEYGFAINDSGWEFDKKDKALVWFVFNKKKLAEKKIVIGPPVELVEHASKFKKKYKGSFTKDHRVVAEVKREFLEPVKYLQSLLKTNYVKERTKKTSMHKV